MKYNEKAIQNKMNTLITSSERGDNLEHHVLIHMVQWTEKKMRIHDPACIPSPWSVNCWHKQFFKVMKSDDHVRFVLGAQIKKAKHICQRRMCPMLC